VSHASGPGPSGPPLGPSLRATLGSPVVVREVPSSPRSRVWLVEFGRAPAIVKQIAGGADAGDRYSREVTALRLAGRARPPVVPGLLAADPDARVLVLEYLTGQRPDGEWMTGYATALARLHATTGRQDAGALPAWTGPSPADARAFLALAARLGVTIPARLPGELDGLLGRLNPAADHALLHGDPCPGNEVHTSGGACSGRRSALCRETGRSSTISTSVGSPGENPCLTSSLPTSKNATRSPWTGYTPPK
jgi:Phosphotransferase enzyme family